MPLKIFSRSNRGGLSLPASDRATSQDSAQQLNTRTLSDRERLELQLKDTVNTFCAAKQASKNKLLNGGFVLKAKLDAIETELDEARARLRDLGKADLPKERFQFFVQRADQLLRDVGRKSQEIVAG